MTFAPKSTRSSLKPPAQRLLREDVHAHRGEVALGLLGLLLPLDDPVVLVHGEDAHARRLGERDAADRDRDVGPVAPMGGDERLVVHLVDVVAGEDEDRVRRVVLEDVEVAQDRVRGARGTTRRPGRARCTAGAASRRRELRSRSHGRPSPMWSLSERGLYWVRTTTSSMSELTQFDSVKSMIRYLPPNGTAGLARSCDRMDSRSPSPPARMTAIVRFIGPASSLARDAASREAMLARRTSARERAVCRGVNTAGPRRPPVRARATGTAAG